MKYILLIAATCLLNACAARSLPVTEQDEPLNARRYQVTIVAHDGVEIGATVWQPDLAAGEHAPLVMHTHGFGLQRMDGRIGLYENFLPSGQIAKALWQQGFWLITWDQRGHGDSGGVIDVINPDREVRDVSTLLDWAEENIRRVSRDAQGDIRVGMIGESYGGGIQTIASVKDARIDAVIPITTWYDLESALTPADVPKGGWISVLNLIGDWWNFRKLDPSLRESFDDAKQGIVDSDMKRQYASHSLKYYCDKNELPHADALIIQGFRDVLFDMQQALSLQECFSRAGHTTNLIAQEGGHLLPFEQNIPPFPWYWSKHLHCLDEKVETESVAIDWMQSKLLGAAAHPTSHALPPVCLSLDKQGEPLQTWPSSYQDIALTSVNLSGGGSGGWRWLTASGDLFLGLRTETSLAKRFASARDAGIRPAFIPLHTAPKNETRFGTPKLHLKTDAKVDTPILAALVKRTAGKASLDLVNDQLAPVTLNQDATLPPIAVTLETGDQLGLILFSKHRQFNTLDLDLPDNTRISGTFLLPASREELVLAKDPAMTTRSKTAAFAK